MSLACWVSGVFTVLLEEAPFPTLTTIVGETVCPILIFGESLDEVQKLARQKALFKDSANHEAAWLQELFGEHGYASLRERLVDLQHHMPRVDEVTHYPLQFGVRNLVEAFGVLQGYLAPDSVQRFAGPLHKDVKTRFFYPDGYSVSVPIYLDRGVRLDCLYYQRGELDS